MQENMGHAQITGYSRKIAPSFEEYTLQFNDVVEINIKTPDEMLNEMLVPVAGGGMFMGGMMMGMVGGGDVFYLTGYILDSNGFVELPIIGKVNLFGLTLEEAKGKIEDEVAKIISREDVFVRVRLGGIRYSALGEFNRPGKYAILQNRVTIFEAIANAGDMNVLANRRRILLIRQYPDGSRPYRLNLNSDQIMDTEFYFIRPNDVIYAEPMKARELGTGINLLQTTQLLISLLTVGVLIYTTTR